MSGTHISGVPTGSPGSNLTQGQVWGKGRRSAFLPGAVVLEMEGGGSCQQLLPDEERLGTELVGSPAPAGSRAAGIDMATAQEGIAAFPASVWEGVAEA